jgi:hypothetical protein
LAQGDGSDLPLLPFLSGRPVERIVERRESDVRCAASAQRDVGREVKAVKSAEAMLLGELSGAAVDRLADFDGQIPGPVAFEVVLGTMVPAGREPSFASLPGEGRSSLGIGHDRSRDELGAFDELPNEE